MTNKYLEKIARNSQGRNDRNSDYLKPVAQGAVVGAGIGGLMGRMKHKRMVNSLRNPSKPYPYPFGKLFDEEAYNSRRRSGRTISKALDKSFSRQAISKGVRKGALAGAAIGLASGYYKKLQKK